MAHGANPGLIFAMPYEGTACVDGSAVVCRVRQAHERGCFSLAG